tara:strand:- start:98 stop:562 length:465 start_codon:yes stop_codon:yes gene_type:complete
MNGFFSCFLYRFDILLNKYTYLLLMLTQKQDVKDYIIDQLESDVGLDQHISDLHHYLLNEDYFIIGTWRAEEWLKKDDSSVFEAIETIREYEELNFGQVSTDLSSSENVANMLAYILGEQILFNNDIYNLFTRFSNQYLNEDKRDLLISSLKGE